MKLKQNLQLSFLKWGSTFVLLLYVIFFSTPVLMAQRLGLHVTKQELDVWRQRSTSTATTGTSNYRIFGDAGTNTPGDWTTIKNRALAFYSSPDNFRWSGPDLFVSAGKPFAGAIEKLENDYTAGERNEPTNINHQGYHIRDAAFYYLVYKNNVNRTQLRNHIKAELLWAVNNAAATHLDFSNETLYPKGFYHDQNPLFMICIWANNYLFALDYVDAAQKEDNASTDWLGEDRPKIQAWFMALATLAAGDADVDINGLFTNRISSSEDVAYTTTNAVNQHKMTEYNYVEQLEDGSFIARYPSYSLNRSFNNRRMVIYRYACLVGIKFNVPALQNSSRRFVKDWLKYGVYPNGTTSDMERYDYRLPDKGWAYSNEVLASAITIADALARTGDISLYTFQTTAGKFGSESISGNEKSLRKVIDMMFKIATKQVKFYGTDEGILFNTSSTAILPDASVPFTATSAPGGAGQPNWTQNPEGNAQMIIRRAIYRYPDAYDYYNGWTKNIGILYNTSSTVGKPGNSVSWNVATSGTWTKSAINAKQRIVKTDKDNDWREELVVDSLYYVKLGNPKYLIDGINVNDISDWKSIVDIQLVQANLFYKEEEIKSLYMHTHKDMYDYPLVTANNGRHNVFLGEWGIYPGILFMFGQMESVITSLPFSQPDHHQENETAILYPNPSHGKITIKLEALQSGEYTFTILNQLHSIYSTKQFLDHGKNHIDLDLSSVLTSSGIYFLKIEQEDHTCKVLKFIKY